MSLTYSAPCGRAGCWCEETSSYARHCMSLRFMTVASCSHAQRLSRQGTSVRVPASHMLVRLRRGISKKTELQTELFNHGTCSRQSVRQET